MDIQEEINRQRIKHIISSYQLGGSEADQMELYLNELVENYPMPLIELALVETLVDHWLTVPLLRGRDFFSQAHDKLKDWESQPIISTITPEQFQQITGLDPSPVFGSTEKPPTRPIVHPS
ncbi:MAG: hypothetical protein SFY66_19110 [Oculatellaceae cyanobacterium bins.114]|nr:hypothetical protein [Oculatellaceae cyanobacterium bins.114]